MEFIGFPKIPRYSRECVITEKIDGTNAQILIVETDFPGAYPGITNAIVYNTALKLLMFAGSRSRYITLRDDNHGFAKWVNNDADELFKLGPGRQFGEWWGQGINRGYGLKEKRFSLFNVKRWGDDSVRPQCCHVVPVLSEGKFHSGLIESTLAILKEFGSQAAPGFMKPEGIVIYHVAGNLLFKKTIEKDDAGKGIE
jgi:hypothetical protein